LLQKQKADKIAYYLYPLIKGENKLKVRVLRTFFFSEGKHRLAYLRIFLPETQAAILSLLYRPLF
jgi:hypothetical protein